MLLTHQHVVRLAKLARIAATHDEIDAFSLELSTIFSLLEKMRAVNTDGIEPMAHPQDIPLLLRDDMVTEYNQRELFQASAPQVEAGLFLVPKVME